MRSATHPKPPAVRVAQAVALLAGSAVLLLVLGGDGRRFHLTPLVLGLAYLAAAAAGGRGGGHWATACALTGWGTAVVLVHELQPDLDTAGLYLAGAGLGIMVTVALGRAGFTADPLGAAVTVTAGGLVLALTPQAGELLGDARTYGVLLALVALVNLGLAAPWGDWDEDG